MSKNTNIADLINYISVDGSGNVVLSTGQLVATQNYVTTAVSNLVASAPSTLDTLNELATALGNDANFATTVTTSIGTKLPLSGGTLTGALSGTSASFSSTLAAMGSNIQFNLDGTFGANYYTMGFGGVSNGFNRISGGTGTTDGLYIMSATGRDIAFRTNGSGTTSMLVNSSGNVGIGTTSPTAKVHAVNSGNGFIYRFAGGTSSEITGGIFASTAAGFASIGTTSNHTFNIFTNDTDRLTVTSGGNVGIGTSSPSYFLDVLSSSVSTARFKDSSRFCLVTIESSGTNQSTYLEFKPTGTGSAIFQVNGTDRMAITSGGNVGIANTSPATKLDVSGTIRSISQTDPTSGVGMELFYRAADTSSYIQSYDRSTDTWKDIRIFGNNLLFGANGTERMRLTTTWPGTIGCLLVNKTTASSSYPIQTQSANGAYMASASGPGDANYYSTSPTIGYHFYGDQGGASKFNVTGAGKGYFASGVQFGSGSSTLNYYQEGSWTPQLYAGSTAFTMSGINDGRYVRVGNQVTISGHLQWSGGSGTGMVRIAGLPFTCSGVRSAGSMGAVSYGISFSSGYNHWILVVDPGADYIYIIQGDSTGGGYSHNAPVGSSGVIYGFSITYHTL